MEPKPGIKTSEFWLTVIANLTGSIVAILAAKGLLSENESILWVNLVESLAVGIIPLALAYINGAYIQSRTTLKAS